MTKDSAGRIVSILRTQVSRDRRVLAQTTLLPGTAPATTGPPAGDTKAFTRRN